MTGRRRAWLWPASLATAGLAFALVPLAQGRFFFYWDNASQHYPALEFLSRSLEQNVLPLWWPEVMGGFPIVAEGQAAHFHPLHLALAWLLPTPAAFMAEFGIAFALTGLGTYAFLRLFRLHRSVCGCAAIMHMFCSVALALVRNVVTLRGACLFGFAMYFAERYARHRRARDGAGLALMIGLQLLSGYPTPSLITAAAVTVHVGLRVLQRHGGSQRLSVRFRRASAAVAGIVLFIALGGAVAAVQLVPTAKHVPDSIRATGLNPDVSTSYLSSKPQHWLQWTMPYAVHPRGLGEIESAARGVSWFYMGALAPLMAIAAFWWRRRLTHVSWPLGLGVLISAVLAVGDRTPVLGWLVKLPVLDSFRYPSRMMYWTTFGCAALAAFGLQHLRVHARTRRPFPWLLIGAWTALIGGSAAVALAGGLGPREIAVSLGFTAIAIAAATGILRARGGGRRVALVVVIATVVVDLAVFRVSTNFARTVPIAETLAPAPIAEWLQRDPDQFRILALRTPQPNRDATDGENPGFLTGPSGTLFGIESLRTNFSLPYSRPLLLGESLERWMTDHPDQLDRVSGLLGALNVKYVISWNNAPVSGAGWTAAAKAGHVTAWKNPAFLPRAFLVGATVRAPSLDEAGRAAALTVAREELRYIGDPDHHVDDVSVVDRYLSAQVDLSKTAVFESDDAPALTGPGTVQRVTSRETPPGRLSYDVESDRAALLYVSVVHGPGWTVTINGTAARLYRANWMGTAVEVPAGPSRVELQYQMPGLRTGAMVSAIATVLVAGLLVAGFRGRRQD